MLKLSINENRLRKASTGILIAFAIFVSVFAVVAIQQNSTEMGTSDVYIFQVGNDRSVQLAVDTFMDNKLLTVSTKIIFVDEFVDITECLLDTPEALHVLYGHGKPNGLLIGNELLQWEILHDFLRENEQIKFMITLACYSNGDYISQYGLPKSFMGVYGEVDAEAAGLLAVMSILHTLQGKELADMYDLFSLAKLKQTLLQNPLAGLPNFIRWFEWEAVLWTCFLLDMGACVFITTASGTIIKLLPLIPAAIYLAPKNPQVTMPYEVGLLGGAIPLGLTYVMYCLEGAEWENDHWAYEALMAVQFYGSLAGAIKDHVAVPLIATFVYGVSKILTFSYTVAQITLAMAEYTANYYLSLGVSLDTAFKVTCTLLLACATGFAVATIISAIKQIASGGTITLSTAGLSVVFTVVCALVAVGLIVLVNDGLDDVDTFALMDTSAYTSALSDADSDNLCLMAEEKIGTDPDDADSDDDGYDDDYEFQHGYNPNDASDPYTSKTASMITFGSTDVEWNGFNLDEVDKVEFYRDDSHLSGEDMNVSAFNTATNDLTLSGSQWNKFTMKYYEQLDDDGTEWSLLVTEDRYVYDTDVGVPTDSDSDFLSDYIETAIGSSNSDTDDDDDGLTDYDEYAKYGTDPTLEDTDGDGISDYDEVYNTGLPFPNNFPDEDDRDNWDVDFDGNLNWLDSDSDGDGLTDGDEDDNLDGDYDSGSDTCDLWDNDTDDDGLLDGKEVYLGSDPCDDDTDSDGLKDGWEVDNGLNPCVTENNDWALTFGDEFSSTDESLDEWTDNPCLKFINFLTSPSNFITI